MKSCRGNWWRCGDRRVTSILDKSCSMQSSRRVKAAVSPCLVCYRCKESAEWDDRTQSKDLKSLTAVLRLNAAQRHWYVKGSLANAKWGSFYIYTWNHIFFRLESWCTAFCFCRKLMLREKMHTIQLLEVSLLLTFPTWVHLKDSSEHWGTQGRCKPLDDGFYYFKIIFLGETLQTFSFLFPFFFPIHVPPSIQNRLRHIENRVSCESTVIFMYLVWADHNISETGRNDLLNLLGFARCHSS